MKNNVLFIIAIAAMLLAGCAGKAQKADDEILRGEEWLRLVFACAGDENAFCFPDEEKICTERYYTYYTEYMGVFEYPSFETDEEQKAAEMEFKNKWKDIYPEGVEMWTPFGRGNGMEIGQKLKNVSIAHVEGLKYMVTVDYGDGLVFKNEVTLVPHGDVFLIDYFKTELIEQ